MSPNTLSLYRVVPGELPITSRTERAIFAVLGGTGARPGDWAAALDGLEHAVKLGFGDAEHMESDPDLETIRGSERYRRLIRDLRGDTT